MITENPIAITIKNETNSNNLSAEQYFINVCTEHFASFIHLPKESLTRRAYNWIAERPSKIYSTFFGRKNLPTTATETTPLINTTAPTVQTTNWKKALAYTTLFGIGSYSAFMYWNSSEESAEYIASQLQSLFTTMGKALGDLSEEAVNGAVAFFKFGIAKFCVAPTNMVLNSQVLFMLARSFASSLYRSEAEKFLTGSINPVPIILGPILGIGAEFPFSSINEQAAKGFKAILMGYLTAITSYPNYAFSSKSFLDSLPVSIFSRVKDDSEKNYEKEKRQALKKTRTLIAMRMYSNCNTLLASYKAYLAAEKKIPEDDTKPNAMESLRQAIDHADNLKKTLAEKGAALKELNEKKSREALHNFLEQSGFYKAATIDITVKTLCQNIASCCAQISKAAFVITPLTIINLAMIFNDGLTAYYAGTNLFKNDALKIAAGSFFAGLTSIASAGFSLSALRGLVQGNSSPDDVVKTTNPKSLILLAGILVFFALFSGGPSALEGYQSTMQLVSKYLGEAVAKEIALTFEALGFVGGDSVNVPFVYFWARWFIHLGAKQQGDETLRSVLSCIDGYQGLGDTLAETKLIHMETFVKDGVFGNTEEELNHIGISNDLMQKLGVVMGRAPQSINP